MWQLAYTEIFFIDKLWPDFNENDFNKIMNKFNKIKRNLEKYNEKTNYKKELLTSIDYYYLLALFFILKGYHITLNFLLSGFAFLNFSNLRTMAHHE